MSKEKFYKRVIACFAFMLVFPALFGETAYGQEKAFYERGNWQTLSVGDEVEGKPYAYTASGSIELGCAINTPRWVVIRRRLLSPIRVTEPISTK